MLNYTKTIGMAIALTGFGLVSVALAAPPPLPIEKTGIIETLPKVYPESWFLVHDAAFFSMSDGKVYVIDTAEETLAKQVKGTFNVALMGNIAQSEKRSEIYGIETFHSRGVRGDRQDVLTIWDQENLSVQAEVMLPGGKRFMGMPQRYAALLLNGDRWLAISNFSPATSVTLVDLDSRKIIREIPTPGCVFTYPASTRGFSSLCADGRFMTTQLGAGGEVLAQMRTAAFFSSDDSPIYERPAVVGDTAYFPSIAGLMFPVDVGADVAKVGEPWHLVPESDRAQNWAPGGIGLIDRDDNGHVYIIMHPDAVDGSYQGGGPEVWVFDVAKRQRVKRIKLREWGLSLAVSRGKKPMLMVVNPGDMSLEMYDPRSGEFLRTITGFGQQTPLMVHRAR
jgi:methylamine dehydrogenase heavy chain